MKKMMLLFVMILMLPGPSVADPVAPNTGVFDVNQNATSWLKSNNNMNSPGGLSATPPSGQTQITPFTGTLPLSTSRSVIPPSGQIQGPYSSSSRINPGFVGVSPRANAPASPGTPNKRFDVDAPTVDPFAPPDSFCGSRWSPPVVLGPGVDAFSPGELTVNPFIPAEQSTATPFVPGSPGFSPDMESNTDTNSNFGRRVTKIRNSRSGQLNPWEEPGEYSDLLNSEIYGSVSGSNSESSYGSPYSLENVSPRSPFKLRKSP